MTRKVMGLIVDRLEIHLLLGPCGISPDIFTARKRSLRRLCFYTCLSFILFTGGGGRVWLLGGHAWLLEGGGVCGIRRDTQIRSMSGRYASYLNAFLFVSSVRRGF